MMTDRERDLVEREEVEEWDKEWRCELESHIKVMKGALISLAVNQETTPRNILFGWQLVMGICSTKSELRCDVQSRDTREVANRICVALKYGLKLSQQDTLSAFKIIKDTLLGTEDKRSYPLIIEEQIKVHHPSDQMFQIVYTDEQVAKARTFFEEMDKSIPHS